MAAGRGGAQDYNGAFDLMKIIAVSGVPHAQINLARLYRTGLGTKRNPVMAAAWYTVARQLNFTAEDLDAMMASLSPAQRKQAQKRVETLLMNP